MPDPSRRLSSRPRAALAVLALGATALGGGAAPAAAAPVPGLFQQGTPQKSERLHRFGQIRFTARSFSVRRIALPLLCTGDGPPVRKEFAFKKGPGAGLAGRLNGSGRFTGTYRQPGASLEVLGRVQGRTAGVTATLVVRQGAATCRATHRFTLRRVAA